MSGQMRMVPGGLGGAAVTGWDIGTALALGAALGVPPLAVAEWLPEIEAAAIPAINRQIGQSEASRGTT